MSTTPSHPECREGEILFCYATNNSFAMIGESIRKKLRKGTLVPRDYRVCRGTRLEDHFPCFLQTLDLATEDSGQTFTVGDSLRFAVQLPDPLVGCSGSRCSNCDGAVAFCDQTCEHCGMPLIGPSDLPDISTWRTLEPAGKRLLAERVFTRKDHGRMGYSNVVSVPLTPDELAVIEASTGRDAEVFASVYRVAVGDIRARWFASVKTQTVE